MSKEQEQKVLSTLYDRLYDIVTFDPEGGKSSQFDKKTTFLQLCKNMPLNEKDFENAMGPANPNGKANTAEAFSRLIDPVPAVQGVYVTTDKSVETNYQTIVEGANATEEPDPHALEQYNKAYNYLYVKKEVKDFEGNSHEVTSLSPGYQEYLDNQAAYFTALSGYRTAFNNYDLEKVEDQRQWQANAPTLEANLNRAWNTYRSGNASYIEQAIQVLDTSVNSAVRQVLEQARKDYSTTSLPSNVPGTPNWHLSYASPNKWYSPDIAANLSEFVIKTGNLSKTESSTFSSYGGGASWSAGLWSVGGSVEGSSGETQSHMASEDFELSAKIGVVQVHRPWLNGAIFSMDGWNLGEGFPPNSIATGQLQGSEEKLMPLITTGFVIARDIQIKCDFATEDKKHVESAVSGSTSVGWGPFKLSGHYSRSSSKDTFNSTYENGVLKIPGIQVIAMVNWIVPASPPAKTDAKAKTNAKAMA